MAFTTLGSSSLSLPSNVEEMNSASGMREDCWWREREREREREEREEEGVRKSWEDGREEGSREENGREESGKQESYGTLNATAALPHVV